MVKPSRQGEDVLDQFFRQMTPDTGIDNAGGDRNIDNEVVAQAVAATADTFTEAYNAADGSSTVVHLPDEGITGNSHFMFQELNNDVIADHIENWIQENVDQ